MTTFSALVDNLVTEVSRPDRRESIAQNVNSVIRELHFANLPGGGSPIKFVENLVEAEFTPTSNPVVWPLPNPANFMAIEAIRDPVRDTQLVERSPRNVTALSRDFDALAYYYRTGNALAMVGIITDRPLQIAYYRFLPALKYKLPAARLVVQNDLGDYVSASDGVSAPSESELEAETNWVLGRHSAFVREGALSKHFRGLNDLERAKMFYSSYESMRSGIQRQEGTG